MVITDQIIDQAFSDLKNQCGGVRNDYFGLVYLQREFEIDRGQAIPQVAFGGNDYGVDGFHFDRDRRNFYIFQLHRGRSRAEDPRVATPSQPVGQTISHYRILR
jgi:hypothetical protein